MDESTRDEELQRRFDEQADELALEPEPVAGGWGEERSVGKAFGMHSVLKAEPESGAKALGDDDRREIEALLRRYAACHPVQFLESWREMATDPFVVFGFGYVSEANEEGIRFWTEKHMESAAGSHLHDPRKVEVTDLRILDLGVARAGATYHLEEEFTDGSKESGHQMAILMRIAGDGWRITGVTKSQHAVDEMQDFLLFEQTHGDASDEG